MALASGVRGWPSLRIQVLMLGRKRGGALTPVITRRSVCKFRSAFDLVPPPDPRSERAISGGGHTARSTRPVGAGAGRVCYCLPPRTRGAEALPWVRRP